MENEARSGSMDFGCITPLYVYRAMGSGVGSLIRFEVKPKIGRKVHKSEGKVQKWQKDGIKIAMD